MRQTVFLFFAIIGMASLSFAQSFSINTDGSIADTSALLDVKSTEKGILVPRMTKAQRNTIFQPAAGLLVYQNGPDSAGFYFYDGSRWQWLITSSTVHGADSLSWKRTGNAGTVAPSPAGLAPIDGDYVGTSDAKDLVIGVNGVERMRFKSNNTFIGFGSTDPKYAMDITMNYDAVSNCDFRNGLRIKLPQTTANINAPCDAGYFMGYSNSVSTLGDDVMFWNFNAIGGSDQNAYRWGYGTDTMSGMQMKLLNYRLGIAQTNPLFALDIKTGPDAVDPCSMNGIRIMTPNMLQGCQRGIFFGYDPLLASNATIWNYGEPGSVQNYIRLGTDDGSTGETMRLIHHKIGINVEDPQAVIHLRDITATRNGIRITSPAIGLSGSYYMGAGVSVQELELSTEYDEPIKFYTNYSASTLPKMTIHQGGNVNIGPNDNPHSTLTVEGTVAVGVSSNIAGGTSLNPVMLTTQGSYVSLAPDLNTEHYELPNAANYVGRIFYFRNISSTTDAILLTTINTICPGNSSTCGPSYTLPANANGKTVIVISDGANWTVGQIN